MKAVWLTKIIFMVCWFWLGSQLISATCTPVSSPTPQRGDCNDFCINNSNNQAMGTSCNSCGMIDFDDDREVEDWAYGCYVHLYTCDTPCVGSGTAPPPTCGSIAGQCSGTCPAGSYCRAKVSEPWQCI